MEYQKPDFSTMNGQQLLDAYNMYSISKRKAKFQTVAEGIKRCEAEFASWVRRSEEANAEIETKLNASDEAQTGEEEDMAKTATKTKAAPKAKAGKGKVKHAKADTRQGSGRRRAGEYIKILTEGKKNPRREGTDAHKHFEAMKKYPKISDYLAQFQDAKKAGQWLWNTVRDGHVELSETK